MLEVVAAEDRVAFIRVAGKVRAEDYRRAGPALRRVLRDRSSRRLMVELSESAGCSLPAAVRGLAMLARDRGRFERVAIKSSGRFARAFGNYTARVTGGRVRCFPLTEDVRARAWLTEGLITWSRPLSAPDGDRLDLVDEASEESFPASDPPGYTPCRL